MKFVTQDYYEILSVSPGATNEEVKRAYRLVYSTLFMVTVRLPVMR